jgi:hypothetical protein
MIVARLVGRWGPPRMPAAGGADQPAG